MRKLLIGSVIFLSACIGSELQDPISNLSYRLTPKFSETENSLDVSVTFAGDKDGETSLRVGGRWGRDEKAGRRFRNLTVTGKDAILPAEINAPLISISHAPGAHLTVTYTLSSQDMDDATQNVEYFYVPVLTSEVFHLIGSTSLVVPRWDDEETVFDVDIAWTGIPAGWEAVDTLPDRPLRPHEISSQILAIAPTEDIAVIGENYELTILKSGQHDFDSKTFQTEMAEIYLSFNALWRADDPKFLVTLLGAPDAASYSSFTGTGRFNSFASAASGDIDLDFLSQFFAHEVGHHWIPGQLGRWPSCNDEENCSPRISWFSEGFTDFIMTQAMLTDGGWTQDELLNYTNQYLRDYYLSPAQTARAHTIDELFWQDYEHEKQPYWRGFLLAMNWDAEIRQQSSETKSAMDVLRTMYENAKAAPDSDKPELTSEYIAQQFSALARRDLFQDVEEHYYNGEVLKPNSEMFGKCAKLKYKSLSPYDVGFDTGETLSTGIVTGVAHSHNAAAAGLENGQKFIAKVSGGGGDSTTPIVLEVEDNGKVLNVSYLPVSGDKVQVPQFVRVNNCNP